MTDTDDGNRDAGRHRHLRAALADWTDPRLGRIIQDRYRILERLGDGAMGVVYRAEPLRLGRDVAIKFLHTELAEDEALQERFRREAWALARVNHPGCVPVIDHGIDEVPFLVMELVEGRNLRTLLQQGALPVGRGLGIARQVLGALCHIHACGIVHRDIKPDNIIVQSAQGMSDHVRLVDFGLAKLAGLQSTLTAGMALGTPNYMAPEQTGVGEISERTDIYAVGVLLFELLTGRKPFEGRDLGETLMKQLELSPPRLADFAGEGVFSPALEWVTATAMERDPSRRFVSAADMLAALDATPEAQAPPSPRGDSALASPEFSLAYDDGPGDDTLFDPVCAPVSPPAPRPMSQPRSLPGFEALAYAEGRRSGGWLLLAALGAAALAGWRFFL